jgi:hypothetical protein
MSGLLRFGERIEGYDVPVLNEREVRAAAGVLFFFALVAFMNAWLLGEFRLTRIFVITFLTDFSIRIFLNPRYSPSMILGRFMVRKQAPEWAGAPQKRFAWAVGWVLALSMLWLIVINNVIGPINLIICASCLTLMFFESAFGICLACKVYNLALRRQAQHCPGGVCEARPARQGSRAMVLAQAAIVVAFIGVIGLVGERFFPPVVAAVVPDAVNGAAKTPGDVDCTPPDWAVAIGHSDMWKLHNYCN